MLKNFNSFICKFTILILTMFTLSFAQEAFIKGEALYLERIALPKNAVFKVTLEDVSLMDAPSVTLGSVSVSPAGQVPIGFEIGYNTDDIKKGHRYSVRGRITVDEKLIYITDTSNPVFDGDDDTKLKLMMKRVKSAAKRTDTLNPFSHFPMHFLGLLPGVNCQDQMQLDLFSEHTYFLRNKCFKNDKSVESDHIGRWYFNAEKKQLVLKGGREAPLFFSVLDSTTIEKQDHAGNTIESSLNYKLEASQTAHTLEPKVLMQGMYQYMADAAMFKECRTGMKLSVLFEKDNLALEKAYLKDQKEAGALLKVHLEGRIVQRAKMEGEGVKSHLLVERFIKTMPNERCGNQQVDASFSNTYWKLTALYGKGIKTKFNTREAHIIFRAPDASKGEFKGTIGCNTMSGSYEMKDQNLNFNHEQITLTRMACPDSKIKKTFLLALKETVHWQIKGDHLELRDKSSKVLARFEAVYF